MWLTETPAAIAAAACGSSSARSRTSRFRAVLKPHSRWPRDGSCSHPKWGCKGPRSETAIRKCSRASRINAVSIVYGQHRLRGDELNRDHSPIGCVVHHYVQRLPWPNKLLRATNDRGNQDCGENHAPNVAHFF